MYTLHESEVVVGYEIPDYHYGNGNKLGPVEIKSLFIDEQINDESINTQANNGKPQILGVLQPLLGVGVVKCPGFVKKKIEGGGKQKAKSVGYIFVHLYFFFSQICYSIIYAHSGESNQAKSDEFDDYFSH
tara:strand:+ start:985 stop:1377 length:393 start_codon:yes stop_codon:yes gene_type:complete